MLETSEERVKLLKEGIDGKDIEKIYIKLNNIKVVNDGVLRDIEGYAEI